MGTGPRRNFPDVIRAIIDHAATHDFTQVAYLLEKQWSERGKIGDGLDKWCRFRPASETSFPAADIRRCRIDDAGRLDIQLNFMGFYGVDSVVPNYFAQQAMNEDAGGKALRAFLDIFNHRLYALLYHAWKKYRPTYHLHDPNNLYLRMMAAFSGWSVDENQGGALAYAGLLGRRIRSAEGLAGLLVDFLKQVPVVVEQFQPRWVSVKPASGLGDAALRLGESMMLGDQILDVSGKVDIRIGPVSPKDSMQLMPSTERGRSLGQMVRRYLPPNIDFDLVILISAGTLTPAPLGSEQLVLGWSTWLQDRVEGNWEVRIKHVNGAKPQNEQTSHT